MLTAPLRRVFAAGGAVMAAPVALSGCFPVLPTRPLALQPVSITAADDRISWVHCLEEAMRINYVAAVVREDSGQEREWTLLTAEGDVEDAVKIAPEDPVDLRSTYSGAEGSPWRIGRRRRGPRRWC